MPPSEETNQIMEKTLDIVCRVTGLSSNQLIECEGEADSVTSPGKKCVKTKPLDSFVTYERFIEEMIAFLRCPTYPLEDLILKRVENKDIGPNSMETKVFYDGKKIKRWTNDQTTPDEFLRTWNKVTWSIEDRYINSVEYDPKEGTATGKAIPYTSTFSHFTKDPLTIEFHFEDAPFDGTRRVGHFPSKLFQRLYVNPIVGRLLNRKVVVEFDQDSLLEEGELSVLTQGLDEFLSYDEIYDGIQEAVLGSALSDPNCMKDPEESTETQTMFRFRNEVDPEQIVCSTRFTHDRESFLIKVEQLGAGDNADTCFAEINYHVHCCPLRVECWMVSDDGTRSYGRSVQAKLQTLLDDVISKHNDGWFW